MSDESHHENQKTCWPDLLATCTFVRSMSSPDPVVPPSDSVALGYECPDPDRPSSASPTLPQLETESPGGYTSKGHDPYAALRLREYQLYAGGWLISTIGQQIQTVAIEWDVYNRVSRTGSQSSALLAMGYVGAVLAAPLILLAVPAGALADRVDRRRIIQCSAVLSAGASIGLALLSHHNAPIGWIYSILLIGAVAQAMGWPARSALLPQLVPAEIFSNAATWNSSAFQVAAMAGPALGGLIIIKSAALAYIVAAIGSLCFFFFLLSLRVRPAAGPRQPLSLNNLAAGFRFVWGTKIILATITLDLFAVLFGGATALLPAYARNILHVGPVGFGWLRAAPAVGALIMALTLAHRPPLRNAGRDMLWAVAGFGAATIVFGFSRWFGLSFAMLLLTGAFDNISVVVRHTLVQMLTPNDMRGRVSAVNNIFIGASNELGAFESGVIGSVFGAVASVISGGIGTMLVVGAVALVWPQVRRFGSLSSARPQTSENENVAAVISTPTTPAAL